MRYGVVFCEYEIWFMFRQSLLRCTRYRVIFGCSLRAPIICSMWYLHIRISAMNAGKLFINTQIPVTTVNAHDGRLIQYIPRNMHTVFALLCFVVVIHWLTFPYPSGLLHWHCGNLTIAPVPAKQPWWIWINTSCEFIMNDCITTTKQSTTKPCAYFLGYTVYGVHKQNCKI